MFEMKNFAKNIKTLRKKNGWSQQKLAEKTGLSYSCITQIEQGFKKSPTIITVLRLADAFFIPLDDICSRTLIRIKKD